MGDRANIVVNDDYVEQGRVWLYGHWSGYQLPEKLRQALDSPEGRGRWNDSAYLTRIIFDHMKGSGADPETGFGISTRMCDNEYDVLLLKGGRVYRVPEGVAVKDEIKDEDLEGLPSYTFGEYVSVPERTWENI